MKNENGRPRGHSCTPLMQLCVRNWKQKRETLHRRRCRNSFTLLQCYKLELDWCVVWMGSARLGPSLKNPLLVRRSRAPFRCHCRLSSSLPSPSTLPRCTSRRGRRKCRSLRMRKRTTRRTWWSSSRRATNGAWRQWRPPRRELWEQTHNDRKETESCHGMQACLFLNISLQLESKLSTHLTWAIGHGPNEFSTAKIS